MTDELSLEDVNAALAAVNAEIDALSARIRRLPDRLVNTRRHIEMVAERRVLMARRDPLIDRLCELTPID